MNTFKFARITNVTMAGSMSEFVVGTEYQIEAYRQQTINSYGGNAMTEFLSDGCSIVSGDEKVTNLCNRDQPKPAQTLERDLIGILIKRAELIQSDFRAAGIATNRRFMNHLLKSINATLVMLPSDSKSIIALKFLGEYLKPRCKTMSHYLEEKKVKKINNDDSFYETFEIWIKFIIDELKVQL